YVPTVAVGSALVQAGLPLTAARVSPVTNPVMVKLKAGFGSPQIRVALAEVTVQPAGLMTKVALPEAAVLFASPAKLAVTGYDPAPSPVMLAVTDARPVASVTALPA